MVAVVAAAAGGMLTSTAAGSVGLCGVEQTAG